MNVRRLLLAGVFSVTCFACPTAHAADPLDQWQLLTTATQSIRGLAYKDGTFVAVGFSTNTVVSTNGTDWFRGNNGLPNNKGLYAVASGAGQFVAVGPFGVIMNSPDGLQWTRRDVYTNEEYWAVIYAGGQFVSVGFKSSFSGVPDPTVALVSEDGVTWQRFGLPFATTPRNVAYGNGVYVAAGAPHSMYSTNGGDWTPLNLITATSVAFGSGRFVMAGGATGYTSTNGIDWTSVTLPDEQYYTGTYANGLFMFGSGDKPYALLAISTNGTDWDSRTFTVTNSYFAIRDILFVDGYYYLGDQAPGRIWRSGHLPPITAPRLRQIAHYGSQTAFAAMVVPGFHYAAEYRNDFAAGGWNQLSAPIFAESEVIRIIDTDATGAKRFYRVAVP